MQSKIPCSAKKLSLLEPTMIESVVESTAFKLGSQYLAENRVRIVDSNSVKISSAVLGNSGMHEQTIQLKDGALLTDCSCPLTEQPICRHAVAVLLEFYRWANPKNPKPQKERPKNELPDPPPNGHVSSNINLRDLTGFVEWIQVAFVALEEGEPLPESPTVASVEVKTWVKCIQNIETQRREIDVAHHAIKTELVSREEEIQNLRKQVQVTDRNYQSAQHVSQTLQRELSQFRIILEKVSDMASDLDRFESQIRGVAGDLSKQNSQLQHLSGSVQQASSALKGFTTTTPA